MKPQVLFEEKQRFKQLWLWLILFALNALFMFGYFQQVFLEKPFGKKPATDAQLLLVMLGMLLLTFLFYNLRLNTKITSEGIFVKFFPFQLKSQMIFWDQLDECYVREYHALKEFGGWGKRGMGYNRALNVSGDKGIQLEFTNGARLLIGTNKPQEAEEVLRGLGQWKEPEVSSTDSPIG